MHNMKIKNLATVRPELTTWWSPKNELSIFDVAPFSKRKYLWICPKGHEFDCEAYHMSDGRGCPICGGKKSLPGFNDVASQYPELLDEWDYSKNSHLPHEYVIKSDKKVWWKCKTCGHEWESRISSRTVCQHGCPICGQAKSVQNRLLHDIEAHGSLLSLYPELCKEWDYDKNERKPSEYLPESHAISWWICPDCGHSYCKRIYQRAVYGQNCPTCSRKNRSEKVASKLDAIEENTKKEE